MANELKNEIKNEAKKESKIEGEEKKIQDLPGQLRKLKIKIEERWQQGKYQQLEQEIERLKGEMSQPGFWDDQDHAKKIMAKEKELSTRFEPWLLLRRVVRDLLDLHELAEEEQDLETILSIRRDFEKYHTQFSQLESLALMNDEDDKCNAFMTIHPGAGGTESQDWAQMLLRMYLRWAEKNNIRVEFIDDMPGEQAGIKTATILLIGENVNGRLRSEIGVHRLVRISPFDSQKRRHTSFASVYVTPEIDESFDIEINEEDLRIDTYRASGAGGQHINTTDSAVRITHIPTNIVVQCQNERSQHKNKSQAMKVLKSALYQHEKQRQEAQKLKNQPEKRDIAWGSQIRSYVFHPYNMVKDLRTNYETSNVQAMMDGFLLNDFIYAYLKARSLNQF